MEKNKIVEELGACGLDCSRCVAYELGEIKTLSETLLSQLTHFEKKAEVFSAFVPSLKHYDHFLAVMQFFVDASCKGCRAGQCLAQGCVAKTCHKEKGVDFCFQCEEYPCTRNQFSEELNNKWRVQNDLMASIGIEAFYERSKKKPRY